MVDEEHKGLGKTINNISTYIPKFVRCIDCEVSHVFSSNLRKNPSVS